MRLTPSASLSALALAISFAANPAAAQEATAQETVPPDSGPATEPDSTEGEILVIAESLRGAVDAPQPPILELSTEDIAAYGVGSVEELISALGPQTSSGRGRGGGFPAILVNGVRISSFREMRSYPPEAIQKIEVFPEEVAQRYGFSADQRVINFILKDNFSSREIEAEYGQPWDGGYSTQEAEATYLMINGPSRLNLNLDWTNSSLLTEAERGVVQSVLPTYPSDPDPADYRSLVSDSAGLSLNGTWTTRLAENGTSLSLNGAFERSNNLRYQGLDTVTLTDPDGNTALRTFNADDPLTVDSRTDTYSLGSTFNAPLGNWQLTATLDGSHAKARSLIQRRADPDEIGELSALVADVAAGTLPLDTDIGTIPDAGFDRAITKTDSASGLATVTGSPFYLPGGDVSVTIDSGYNWTRIRSEDTRNPGLQTSLKRGDLSGGINVGVPITSVRDDFGAAIGDVSLQLSGGVDHLSDFGTLTDWSVGLTWSPVEILTFNGSYIARDQAPSLSQLGDPEIATPNVPVFDLVRNETVLVTVVTGGNPGLPKQSQGDWKLSANLELPIFDRSNFSIDYFDNHSDDVAASFPVLTPTIEAAFPDRVVRDASGQLVSVDQRPVTFTSQDSRRIQFGLNMSGSVGSPRPQSQGQGQGGGPGGPGGPRFGGGAGGQRNGAPGAGGPPAGFDPAKIQAFRTKFCADSPDGTQPELTEEDLANLPPMLVERLKGDNGEVDPERLAQFRSRFCSNDGPRFGGQGQGQRQGQQAQGGSGGPPRGGPGFMRPGGGNGQGRWFANITYAYEIENKVLVAPGGPLLNLLDGDALTGGGGARHSATARGGMFYSGFGGRVSATYTGSSRINGTGLPGSTDLRFDDFVTFDIRLFADLNQQEKLIEAMPILKGTRISFNVDNVFDARQYVVDSSGTTPLRYQPYLIDPVGRFFEVELRKLF